MAHEGLGQDSLAGRTLGHYRIVEKVGEGGIGFVYRACDEHLDNRQVAIKILRSGSLADPIARQRFRKEAHTVSKLSHPNIAMVFDFNCEDGTDFLVEEFVEGISLDDMLEHGALAQKEIVALGTQLCEGLAAAHEHNVIHRDIKPGNLRVTPDAQLKILDFGLAQHLHQMIEHKKETASMSETQIVAGTLPYLSPEQIRNEKLSARTDIWAAGCVLYEMATGRRPFLGQSTALIDEILRQIPALPSKLNQKMAPGVDSIILKCLEKDPSLRYASARDVAVDLRRLALTSSTTLVVSGPVKKTKKWPWVGAATAVALLAALLTVVYQEATLPPPRIVATRQLTHTRARKDLGFLATDGSRVYFVEQHAGNPLALMQVATTGGEAIEIPATEPVVLLGISPSGSELLVADCCPAENFWIQPIPAGPPRRAPFSGNRWGVWGDDGNFYYVSPDNELYRVKEDGSQREHLFTTAFGLVDFGVKPSPDGRKVRFVKLEGWTGSQTDVMEAAMDGSKQRLLFPELKGHTRLGGWTADGNLFYFGERNGASTSLAAVRETNSWFPFGHRTPTLLYAGPLELAVPVASRNSKELYAVGADRRGELVVYDPRSSSFVPYLGGISASYIAFSPDGKWIAYVSYPEGVLWKSRVDGSDKMQLTFAPMGVVNPRWSPDGKSIVFTDLCGSSDAAIYIVPAEGAQSRLVATGPRQPSDAGWLHDGDSIVYGGAPNAPVQSDIEVLDLKRLLAAKIPGSENLFSPRLSPDGKYIAALGTGPYRLMLYDYSRNQWRTLLEGKDSSWPAWSHDSKSVYVLGLSENKIYRIEIATAKSEVVVDLQGIHLASSMSLGWFGLTPDDRIMLLRDTGTQEIYALQLEY